MVNQPYVSALVRRSHEFSQHLRILYQRSQSSLVQYLCGALKVRVEQGVEGLRPSPETSSPKPQSELKWGH